MTAQHLVKIAELLCGPEARRQVFEPLVADWAREWADTRAFSRTRALVSGAVAFCRSLMRCAKPVWWVSVAPWPGYVVILLVFAAAGAALALQPLQYMWIGAGVRFLWVPQTEDLAYFLPKAMAYMAAFALLPVVLLATAAGWRWRRLLAGVSLTLVAMIVVDGWVAPAALRARDGRLGQSSQEISSVVELRLYASAPEVLVLASGSGELAVVARHKLLLNAQVIAISLSFAFLGFALGRTRSGLFRRPSLLALGGCWLAAWTTYQVLDYWGQYLVALLGLGAMAPWFGPVVFASVAIVVMMHTGGNRREPPSARRSRAAFREAQPSGLPRTQ